MSLITFASDSHRRMLTNSIGDIWEEFLMSQRTGIQNVLVALPADAEGRKETPITTGVLDYFPAAIAEVARVSKAGNDQHNPGEPLNWARGKSTDHADCIVRHLLERGTRDTDGQRHTAKVAWRALALLQEELEAEAGFVPGGGAPGVCGNTRTSAGPHGPDGSFPPCFLPKGHPKGCRP